VYYVVNVIEAGYEFHPRPKHT